MAGKTTPVLLVTANVGSIFEDPSHMLKIWTEEFLSIVARLDPKFIALHCQEVGGKNYERSMKHVEDFVRLFMSSEELRLFDKVRVYLDEDYSSAENFTALGNFYFIHESLSDVLIWDFAAMTFVSTKGKEIHSGNIEAVTTKEKSKFPQDFFPECKWSRKGFLRTRWSLNGTVFDLINIHLFHDASNFIAMESFPSVYSKNRRRALEHTLERFHNDSYGIAPFFVFGDFNFRTDTQGVINKLADGLSPVRVQSNKNNDHTKLQYKDDDSQVVLSLGKKEFSHADHQSVFLDENGMWLKEFDREMEAFSGRLFEFPIAFPPSYPFEEDEKGGNNYMKTRCPAWCDRVILSNTAKTLVNNVSEPGSVEYGLMGPDTRMGDHKPVYLKMDLINDAGTVSCCTSCDTSSSDKRVLCFGNVAVCEPASWSCRSLSLKQGGSAPSTALTLRLDTSAAALAADCFLAPPHASLLHEPYTPESMETPSSSPIPIRIQRDFEEIENVEWKCDEEEEETLVNHEKTLCNDLSKMLTDKEQQSGIQVMSPSKKSMGGCEFSAKECFNEISPDSLNGNNSGLYKNVYQGVPHVFICYSDMQESCVCERISTSTKCAVHKAMQVDPDFIDNAKHVSLKENHTRQFQEESHKTQSKNCTYKNSDFSVQKHGNLSPLSVTYSGQTLSEVTEKNTIIQENVRTSLVLKPLSPDFSILPTASGTSYVPSLNPQSLKKDQETVIEISPSSNKIHEKVAENKVNKEISSGVLENTQKGEKHTSESIFTMNHNDLGRQRSSHSLSIKESIKSIEDTRISISIDHNIHIMPIDTNESAEIYERRGSNLQPLSVQPAKSEMDLNCRKESVLKEKLNIPDNSQDCINVINTEISSQLKKTKKHKPEDTKDTKLKESSKKTCSSCCSII